MEWLWRHRVGVPTLFPPRLRRAAPVLAAFLLASAPALAEPKADPAADPALEPPSRFERAPGARLTRPVVDCSCRRPGGRSEIGETACILNGGEWVLARCEMTLNNTSWRPLDKPCGPVS